MRYDLRCQAAQMTREVYSLAGRPTCSRPTTTTRSGYGLCWTCAAAHDMTEGFAANVARSLVAPIVDGAVGQP